MRLRISTWAVTNQMGQQRYEREIVARAATALGPDWAVDDQIVRSLRSELRGTVRLPVGAVVGHEGRSVIRRAAGAYLGHGSDVFHRMDLRLPPVRGEVVTIHDLAPLRLPDEGTLPSNAAAEVRRAARIICPSEFAADEVETLYRTRRPIVIPNGVDEAFFTAEPATDAVLHSLGVRRPFVLHAGGCSVRKNLGALAEAWQTVVASNPAASLVLVGPQHDERDRLFGPLPATIRLGRVPFDSLLSLMASATAVVVPSTYEGFGIPALEGMAVGVPVVASRAASLPEVCGDDAILVEPSARGLAEGIRAALDGGPEIERMVSAARIRARAFTWAASAAAHAAVWREVA